jgi:hypothetical protein
MKERDVRSVAAEFNEIDKYYTLEVRIREVLGQGFMEISSASGTQILKLMPYISGWRLQNFRY